MSLRIISKADCCDYIIYIKGNIALGTGIVHNKIIIDYLLVRV